MFKYYGFSYVIKIINHVLNYIGVCLQLGFVVNFVRQVDWWSSTWGFNQIWLHVKEEKIDSFEISLCLCDM